MFPACDDDGDVVAYIFTFALAPRPSRRIRTFSASVKEGRKIAREGLNAMTQAEKQKVLDEVMNKTESPIVETRSGGPNRQHRSLGQREGQEISPSEDDRCRSIRNNCCISQV